jgi:type I restriction enzyme R subunit
LSEKPEAKARRKVDRLLDAAGWKVQDYKHINLGASRGVAVTEFPLKHGFADYLLFIDRKVVGVVEAKPEGTTLSGVAEQSTDYLRSIPKEVPHIVDPLPFAYESTGSETFFRDSRDPESRSRRVFAFHRPETFDEWLSQEGTLRLRMRNFPSLISTGLRDCQIDAIKNVERSFSEDRPRALIQMASGSGKTYTAVYSSYRLIKHARARRILFLVDRNTLGLQTKREFQQFVTPDDGRKFTELYNVQHLTSNKIDLVSNVCITTIQRLYSMLKGEAEFDPTLEDASLFESGYDQGQEPREVSYNDKIPIETFDFIITDECHRSIYNLWRQVLEYFDAYLIGLTATPSRQTLGFFDQNLVTEYSQESAIAAGVNVGYDVYRIKTEITQQGSTVDAGYYVDKRDKLTRKLRWEQLDEALEYLPAELDKSIVSKDQIRTVIRTFKEKLFTDLFPSRNEVPKTLIFAKDDSHAEDIVQLVREEFGKGNEFCKKITYRTYGTSGEKPEDLISSFRNSYNPRIAVTVDMISTGTDIKPLECLLFMRDVKSRVFFEQMKGRGARTISDTDIRSVTPDARQKTRYVIVDAVGVCEHDKTDSRPLERERGISFEKLLTSIALGNRNIDYITSLVNRLAILERELEDHDRESIIGASGGTSINDIIKGLLNSIDPDKVVETAAKMFGTDEPSATQIQTAQESLLNRACSPFDQPELRNLLLDIRRRNEQVIDSISKDRILLSGFGEEAHERAEKIIGNFREFIEANKDELTALQIIYGQPYARRRLTYEAIRQLADAIGRPPCNSSPDVIWQAFEQLEKPRVRSTSPQRLLTNIISLVRFAVGQDQYLEPFREAISRKFEKWLSAQEEMGRFDSKQKQWLIMIKDHIASSLWVAVEDLELSPFYEKGGPVRFYTVFGSQSDHILDELNKVLLES